MFKHLNRIPGSTHWVFVSRALVYSFLSLFPMQGNAAEIFYLRAFNLTEYGGPPGACDIPAITGYSVAEVGKQLIAKNNEVTQACGGVCRNPGIFVSADEVNQTFTIQSSCTGNQATHPVSKITDPKQECCTTEGNPGSPLTGQKIQTETDYTSSNLVFSRTYNSLSLPREADDLLGIKWRHSYDNKIYYIEDSGFSAEPELENPIAQVWRSSGQVLRFTKDGESGQWNADPDVTGILLELIDAQGERTGWEYRVGSNRQESYNLQGQLVGIRDGDGLVTTLVHDLLATSGGDDNPITLDQIIDPFNRTLTFTYSISGLIEVMTDPEGGEYLYEYNGAKNLSKVIFPDETPGDNTDNVFRSYHYENPSFPNHLTGITDENGVRFATWTYDAEGRVTSSEHVGGAERVDFTYNGDGSTTVEDVQGGIRNYEKVTQFNVEKPASVTGGQCSNCGSQYSAITYDASGFVSSRTDFNGNVTTYINNIRGLEISRTEAVGASEERTISTDWHPDFRLPIKITEPGKETNYSYDSVGRLLSVQEVAL